MKNWSFNFRPAAAERDKKAPGPVRLQFESLELRALMTADPSLTDVFANGQLQVVNAATGIAGPTWLTPAQVSAAYGFNQISFGNVKGTGAGQTIAIVDAYDDPNIAQDLQVFDKQYGLAAANFTKVEMSSGGSAPATNADWDIEISLDVEWAHAMAPGANILLVEAHDSSLSSLLTAVNYARNAAGVSVVSMSWGSSEFSGETSYDSYFTTPAGHSPVAFVASSGDNGVGAIWPSVSTNVLGVGGTSLQLTTSGAYGTETAWSGSGGGYSSQESEPTYQRGVQTTGHRSAPDVSYDANPNTGFIVYDSVPYNGSKGWWIVGGTSAGAPQWSALIAIADQGLTAAKKADIGNAAAAVYSLSSSDFHDITSGSNGYAAGKGYDLVTGLGSPLANKVVADLVSPPVAKPAAAAATPVTAASLRSLLLASSGMDTAGNLGALDAPALTLAGSNPGGGNSAANALPSIAQVGLSLGTSNVVALAEARLDLIDSLLSADLNDTEVQASVAQEVAFGMNRSVSGQRQSTAEAPASPIAAVELSDIALTAYNAPVDRQRFEMPVSVDAAPQATDDFFASETWFDPAFQSNAGRSLPKQDVATSISDKAWLAAAVALAGYWQMSGNADREDRAPAGVRKGV